MPIDIERLLRTIVEFNGRIDASTGLYLDATQGFAANSERLDRGQQAARGFGITEDLDSLAYIYGRGDPNQPDSPILHSTTQGEFRHRNTRDGPNARLMAQLVLVLVYALWEDRYRQRLAQCLSIKKNDLHVPVFGDLRRLRNAILHNHGRGTPDTERKMEVLDAVEDGAPVAADEDTLLVIVLKLKESLDDMAERHSGERLHLGRIRFMGDL